MTLTLTKRLQEHLGLLPFHLKTASHHPLDSDSKNGVQATTVESAPAMPKPELEKNEFRLLVKILQAIGHECEFKNISYANGNVIYNHPKKTLIFHDISIEDDNESMNLSSLEDMNTQTNLKRAVWEKLKTLS